MDLTLIGRLLVNYALGIDIGTSYTAAATWCPDGPQNRAEVVVLGNRAASVASVLVMTEDRTVLVGEAAERRAISTPDRVIRQFKRRIGDDTPLFVGGEPYPAHDLAATMVRWVIDRVTEREGGPADRIAVTHPASWGPYKKDLLRAALSAHDPDNLSFLAEPAAAAISYASLERVEAGTTIAVYDLGGGTFDAAVVRKTGAGSFTLLGTPEGLEQLGGADFDEAVFAHVRARLGAEMDALDIEDPSMLSGLARLRRECTEAKEALSSDTEVAIPVLLPGINTQVRLVRSEFEDMIRPALEETVEALYRAIRSADLTSQDLGAVLLVGGSSRVPLVAQMVSAELGCPVVVDADPKTTIALGAALSFIPHATPDATTPDTTTPDTTTTAVTAPPTIGFQQPLPDPDPMPDRPMIPAQRQFTARESTEEDRPQRRKLAIGGLCSVVAIGLTAGAILLVPTLPGQSGSSMADTQSAIPLSGAGAAESSGAAGATGATGATGNTAKISGAGGLSFRGREDTATISALEPGSPTGRAGPAAPVDNAAQGRQVSTPATSPPSTMNAPQGWSTREPQPPPTTEQPPPTTEQQPPTTEQQPPTTEQQPPTTEEPPPTTEQQPAGSP
ncbi:MAG: Hsp70 family protein [Pseudonocardiaceae bacterium]